MGPGAVGPAGALSLAGALGGDSGVQPAGILLPLDLGRTVPAGGDVLSHGRGLDVSAGTAGGLGGQREGWGSCRGGGVPSRPCFLCPRHRSWDLARISSAGGFCLQKPR